MALGDSYATEPELRHRLRDNANVLDANELINVLATVSRGIELICGRQFNKTTSATARVFYPRSRCLAIVDDFHTTSGLIVATDTGDGSYATTHTAADYQLEPLNGIVAGQTGWPYWIIRSVGSLYFPVWNRRAPLQVTAQWGWAAVPPGVKEACLVVAGETASLPEAKFGIASSAEWGVARVRANPMAMAMIAPYILDPVLVA